MKKLIYLFSISFVMIFFTSCFEEIDNWYTETAGYDGRYQVAVSCDEYDDDNLAIEDGEELMIYNSAANVANEIIIDTHVAGYAIKGKFTVSGSPADFKGTAESVNVLYTSELINSNNYLFIYNGNYYTPSGFGPPDELGEEYEAVQLYSRITLESGKITSLGATTIGGNKSDGVNLKITCYFDEFMIESYETPQDTWDLPDVPELAWRIKAGTRKNKDGWEEHWSFNGYRYTGYPEDIGAPVPVIEN